MVSLHMCCPIAIGGMFSFVSFLINGTFSSTSCLPFHLCYIATRCSNSIVIAARGGSYIVVYSNRGAIGLL